MKVKELVVRLLDYNMDADVFVMAGSKPAKFTLCYGSSAGATKESCDMVVFHTGGACEISTARMQQYFPSNGTEGEGFMDKFCAVCRKDTTLRKLTGKVVCPILSKSLMGDKPKQWIQEDGMPRCTSFRHYQRPRVAISVPKNQLKFTF